MKKKQHNKQKTKPQFLLFLARLIVILIAVILGRLCFPKPSLSFTAFIFMVPFFIVLFSLERLREGFFWGFVFGFGFYYSNVFWLNTLTVYNSFIPLGIVLLGAYLGLYAAVFGWASMIFMRKFPRAYAFFLPALWVCLEYPRNWGQLAFPWSYLSASQWNNIRLIQIADITGTWGISFFIVLVNLSIAVFLKDFITWDIRSEKRKFPYLLFQKQEIKKIVKKHSILIVIVLCLFFLILVYGFVKSRPGEYKGASINVAIVQPNIPQPLKFASYAGSNAERQQIPAIIESMNFEVLGELKNGAQHLVILPESAFTRPYFKYQKNLLNKLGNEAKRLSAGILVGANREIFLDKNGNQTTDRTKIVRTNAYNSAWYFVPNGILHPTPYDKIQLVPFGENLPYFDMIPGLQKMLALTGSFLKGEHHWLFPVPYKNPDTGESSLFFFGTVICFESSFSWIFRTCAIHGADFMTIITNDAWYEDSAGAYQHFSLAIFRAIETRQWIVRCSNRGISCVISPKGRVVRASKLNEKTIVYAKIFPKKMKTVYQLSGDLFVKLLFASLAVGILLIFKNKLLRKK